MPRKYKRKDGHTSNYYTPTGKDKGRPSKFNEFVKDHALTLARSGLSDNQIAEKLKVGSATFNGWKKKFPEFSSELEQARDDLIIAAQKTLMVRVKGVKFKEKKETIVTKQVKGKTVTTSRVEVTEKWLPPDVQAAQFVLDRRMKEYKRKVPEEEEEQVNEPIKLNLILQQDTPDE